MANANVSFPYESSGRCLKPVFFFWGHLTIITKFQQ